MKTNINKMNEADWEELQKIGKELEDWRNNPFRDMDISKIFSNPKWKLARMTFSDIGEALTIGIYAAVEPEKNLFYNNPIFQGANISSDGGVQINYIILTQQFFDKSLITKKVKVKYSVYDFKDC
jgi:hypothetical protein